MARAQGNDRDQMRGVIAGLADVCVVNTYYLGKLLNTWGKMPKLASNSVCFPNQNDRGGKYLWSRYNHASETEVIHRSYQFLSSEEAQYAFSEATMAIC